MTGVIYHNPGLAIQVEYLVTSVLLNCKEDLDVYLARIEILFLR